MASGGRPHGGPAKDTPWEWLREARAVLPSPGAPGEFRRPVIFSLLFWAVFVVALAALARSFDGAGPEVSFEHEGGEKELPEEAELVLYRATQEGLTNAAKHSRARRSRVRLVFEPGRARLAVTDDGEGAPEGTAEDGFGIPALRERAEALGGTLTAGNRPEGGFGLEITLPIGQVSVSGDG